MIPKRASRPVRAGLSILALAAVLPAVAFLAGLPAAHAKKKGGKAPKAYFQRIATFPVFENMDIDTETVAEIVTATNDGKTLIYTDSETGSIGFVDIKDPHDPVADGVVSVGGEPTSVGFVKGYALACVNTSADYVDTSGDLVVIDVKTRDIVQTFELGGQPDSIAISPNGKYAAIAIENERDEDLGDGAPPQLPAGYVVVVDLKGKPGKWKLKKVDLVGIPEKFPTDPEPEFIDINKKNIAAVTCQENNHVVLIDLKKCKVVGDFSCGNVTLGDIDTAEDDVITLDGMIVDRPREPDAVVWIDDERLATADEGDLDGGTRGFTIFKQDGTILYEAGTAMEHLTVRTGHYPEGRSENKGNEPEGITFGRYGKDDLLFVGSERSSVVGVFWMAKDGTPVYHQVLPAGIGPEGLKTIPHRGLFVAASENDSRDDKFRASISIYQWVKAGPTYPTVESDDDDDGNPIPWAALSALAGDPDDAGMAYTVQDSFFKQSRIFALDVSAFPAVITEAIVLKDGDDTVDLDPEGLAVSANGGFWLASEGSGSVDDPDRPVTSLDLLFHVDDDGTILDTVSLPASVNALQRRFGFEGVSSVGAGDDETLYVAFQREWVGDPKGKVRIGVYDVSAEAWTFLYYPLDAATSPNGGWVGLSEIVHVEGSRFAVIERDNQAGPDARIKRIYEFSVAGVTPMPQGGVFPTVSKTLVRDLMPDLESPNGLVIEKVEGLTILANGDVLIVTDNDGVDDSSGETQLLNLGDLFGLGE